MNVLIVFEVDWKIYQLDRLNSPQNNLVFVSEGDICRVSAIFDF